MKEQYYNLPMVRENFFSRNLKKLFNSCQPNVLKEISQIYTFQNKRYSQHPD